MINFEKLTSSCYNRVGPVLSAFFAAGLVLLPFDSLPYFRSIFREIGAMAPFYPFSLGMLVFGFCYLLSPGRNSDFSLRRAYTFWILIAFLVWTALSVLVNWDVIQSSVFKGRTGGTKAALQGVLLLYCSAIAIYAYSAVVLWKMEWEKIEMFVLFSFLVPVMFSVVEVLYLYGVTTGDFMRTLRGYFSVDIRLFERARTVSAEPSFFAVYVSFLYPWLLSWTIRARGRVALLSHLVLAYFIFLLVLTLSRTAYITVLMESLVFISLAAFLLAEKRRVILVAVSIAAFFLIFNLLAPKLEVYNNQTVVVRPVSTMLSGAFDRTNPVTGQSTRIRLGAQIANFKIASSSPFWGVGLGQSGFHMYKYIPAWVDSWYCEVKNWKDNTPGTDWASAHGLFARIAAESGFMGLIIWICLWGGLAVSLLLKTFKAKGPDVLVGATLLTSLCGVAIYGVQLDSFRFFESWILLGLSWAYLYNDTKRSLSPDIYANSHS